MSSDALELLTQLLKVPSFTPTHPEMHNFEACQRALDIAETFVREHTVPARVERLVFGEGAERVDNLLVHWDFYPQKTQHLCFIGHLDVVPVEEDQWSMEPFGADVVDGYIYGRGATDMKGSVAAFLAAMKTLHETRQKHNVTMVLTTDEEWDAKNGTLKVLQYMDKQMIWPHAFIAGEPSNFDIAVRRRGSLNIVVELGGNSGHVSEPDDFINPLDNVPAMLEALKAIPFEDDPSWLSKTQLVITKIVADGGSTAITPFIATIRLNIRHTDTYSAEQLHAMVRSTVMQALDKRLNVAVIAKMEGASVPYRTGPDTRLQDILMDRVEHYTGRRPALTHRGGTSDNRFVKQVFKERNPEVIEFGPLTGGGYADNRKEGGMHQADERLKIEHLNLLTQIYVDAIPQFCVTRKEVPFSEVTDLIPSGTVQPGSNY